MRVINEVRRTVKGGTSGSCVGWSLPTINRPSQSLSTRSNSDESAVRSFDAQSSGICPA
jgi:hypothetical protein